MARGKWSVIPSSEITPEAVYVNRRQFMKGLALGAGALALAGCVSPSAPAAQPTASATRAPAALAPGLLPPADAQPVASKTTDELGDPLTSHEAVTTYNNFYEFGMGKDDPAVNAKGFRHLALDGGGRRAGEQAQDVRS